VRRAKQLIYTTSESIPDRERENLISILLGKNQGPIARGLQITEQPNSLSVPAGFVCAFLERRARESEENLIAANAEMGVVEAAYFRPSH
jgi:multidrug efflux system outer membrane protein